jgi:hypothetical protein
MEMYDRQTFRERCLDLHKLVRTTYDAVHDFAPLLNLATQYRRGYKAAMLAEKERQFRREGYFLVTVFAPGKEDLRDIAKPVEGLIWSHYRCDGLTAIEALKGSPGEFQRVAGSYYYCNALKRARPPLLIRGTIRRQRERRVRRKCWITAAGSVHGELTFSAWAPPEFELPHLPEEFDECPLPLPPARRNYSDAEIAYAFVVLHDADGCFQPLIPEGHELDDHELFAWKERLTAWDRPHRSQARMADNTWVISLEPLLKHLLASIASESADMQNQDRSSELVVPQWDHDSRRLYYNGDLIRELSEQAKNIANLLQEFQRLDWPKRLADPLPFKPGVDPVERVKNTCKSLNNGLRHIHFHAGDGGTSFVWARVDSDEISPASHSKPTMNSA